MKTTYIISGILLFILFWGCSDSDEGTEPPHDCPMIIIDKDLYSTATSNNYSIVNAEISGDCLEIEISSSGCDGSSWELDLYDSEEVAESYPVQRFIKLSLINNELCDAVISKTISFDLTPIQLEYGSSILHLEGWGKSMLYEY